MATLRESIPLRKAKILKRAMPAVAQAVVACVVMAVYVLTDVAGEFPRPHPMVVAAWFVGWTLYACLGPIYQVLYFNRYFYDADDVRIVIRKGVVAVREITLPFSKITDVYVDRDLLDAALGLYDVHISTPTEQSGRFAHIDGVNAAGSARLKELILDRVHRADSAA